MSLMDLDIFINVVWRYGTIKDWCLYQACSLTQQSHWTPFLFGMSKIF